MADKFSKEVRSRIMSAIRSKNTKPEVKLRKALFAEGHRFRIHYKLLGSPDIVFPGKRVAIFVDGCFWHMCPKHGHLPKSNKAFWRKKLERNVSRDKRYDRKLRMEGWKVIHVWEHDLKYGQALKPDLISEDFWENRYANNQTRIVQL